MTEIQTVKKVVELVTGGSITSPRRIRNNVESRMIFAYLLRSMGHSLCQIGGFLKKDHTTIMHYERKAADLMITDQTVMRKYLKCKQLLNLKEQEVNLEIEKDLPHKVKSLTNLIETLEKEKQDLIKEMEMSSDKRFFEIFKLIRENTPHGRELLVERKIRKMFNV